MAPDNAGTHTVTGDSTTNVAGSSATRPLSAKEAAALARVETMTRLLDEAIRVPGTNFRVGLDPILGILPIAGDAVATILSLYPVVEAYRLGVPKRTLATMVTMVAIDAFAGSVPILGDVFDAYWKANRRNYRLLEGQLGRS
jgi:hypothetical protein